MLENKRIWWAGGSMVILAVLVALSLPTGSVAEQHEEALESKANHFKCYEVLDWGDWQPTKAQLKDQFGGSDAHVVAPRLLCNPVDKNGEGIPVPESHLVCYEIRDNPSVETERIKEVEVKNQFYAGTLWVGSSNLLCVPSDKRYQPRG